MENDKIRKAFKQWFFSSPENAPFPCFKAGYKSALKEAQAEIERLKEKCELLYHTGRNGIEYVGSANYQSREDEALEWMDKAFESLPEPPA